MIRVRRRMFCAQFFWGVVRGPYGSPGGIAEKFSNGRANFYGGIADVGAKMV